MVSALFTVAKFCTWREGEMGTFKLELLSRGHCSWVALRSGRCGVGTALEEETGPAHETPLPVKSVSWVPASFSASAATNPRARRLSGRPNIPEIANIILKTKAKRIPETE